MTTELLPADYPAWLETLKARIAATRSRAALAVNAELIQLYHGIGRDILERQTRDGWGSKVITRVADDLKAAFPDMKGFSASNVKYMRYFAEHCPNLQFGQQPADQLPWFHIVTLLTKAEPQEREWYAVNDVHKPIGIAEFELLRDLPAPLADKLPSIEQIEAELANDSLPEDEE